MASLGYVTALINGLEAAVVTRLEKVFAHTLTTYRLGTDTKAANFSWYRVQSTTAATANEEFSIAHGLEAIPTHLIPVLDLSVVNSETPKLINSKAPDRQRVYLKSDSTSTVFVAYLETGG